MIRIVKKAQFEKTSKTRMTPHTVCKKSIFNKGYFVFKRYKYMDVPEKKKMLIFTFLMFSRPLLKFESCVKEKFIFMIPAFTHMKRVNFKAWIWRGDGILSSKKGIKRDLVTSEGTIYVH